MPVRRGTCAYFKLDGSICGQGCFGEYCYRHVDALPLSRCRHCGRVTYASAGYCSTQQCVYAGLRAATAARRADASASAPTGAAASTTTNAELDNLVEELLAS
jgi:hypothetical protein